MVSESTFVTRDGVRLYLADWPVDSPKAVCLLVHGLGEHCRRYDRVAASFNAAGIALAGFDHRGHGRSQGAKGHIPSIELALDDIDQLLERTASTYPETPLFLYGHSMGGMFVLYHAITREPELNGVIATSPHLAPGKPLPALKLSLVSFIRKLFPGLRVNNELDSAYLSHDLSVVDAYRKDPLVTPLISTSLALDILQTEKWVVEHAGAFNHPLLMLQGSEDIFNSPAMTREFAAKVPPDLVTYLEYDGKYHELHNEIGWEAILEQMTEWILAH